MKIVWNYEDVEIGIISVMYNGKYLGFFKMETDIFIYMDKYDPDNSHDNMHISLLRQIVKEYDEALTTAKKMIKE